MDLSSLRKGQVAIIKKISLECKGETRQRLLDLGFVNGTEITMQCTSPLRDPIAYNIHNTLIALRQSDAKNIIIEIIEPQNKI